MVSELSRQYLPSIELTYLDRFWDREREQGGHWRKISRNRDVLGSYSLNHELHLGCVWPLEEVVVDKEGR